MSCGRHQQVAPCAAKPPERCPFTSCFLSFVSAHVACFLSALSRLFAVERFLPVNTGRLCLAPLALSDATFVTILLFPLHVLHSSSVRLYSLLFIFQTFIMSVLCVRCQNQHFFPLRCSILILALSLFFYLTDYCLSSCVIIRSCH